MRVFQKKSQNLLLKKSWQVFDTIYIQAVATHIFQDLPFSAPMRSQKTVSPLVPFIRGVRPTSWCLLGPWDGWKYGFLLFCSFLLKWKCITSIIKKVWMAISTNTQNAKRTVWHAKKGKTNSFKKNGQSGGVSRWRVCPQRATVSSLCSSSNFPFSPHLQGN